MTLDPAAALTVLSLLLSTLSSLLVLNSWSFPNQLENSILFLLWFFALPSSPLPCVYNDCVFMCINKHVKVCGHKCVPTGVTCERMNTWNWHWMPSLITFYFTLLHLWRLYIVYESMCVETHAITWEIESVLSLCLMSSRDQVLVIGLAAGIFTYWAVSPASFSTLFTESRALWLASLSS